MRNSDGRTAHSPLTPSPDTIIFSECRARHRFATPISVPLLSPPVPSTPSDATTMKLTKKNTWKYEYQVSDQVFFRAERQIPEAPAAHLDSVGVAQRHDEDDERRADGQQLTDDDPAECEATFNHECPPELLRRDAGEVDAERADEHGAHGDAQHVARLERALQRVELVRG